MNADEVRKNVAEFEAKLGMLQAFVCIDGRHISVIHPATGSHNYVCYKGLYSRNVI